MRAVILILALLVAPAVQAAEQQAAAGANPIRKVVGMLQKMQTTIEAEGEKETELFDKYMCYCKNGASSLAKSISDAGVKMPELASSIEAMEGQKSQLDEDLKTHRTDRDAAKAAMVAATALREKQAAAFAAESDESKADIASVAKATAAIEKGMGSAFLQTTAAQTLTKLVQAASSNLFEDDRQAVMSFLSQGEGYAPASGQITGILKTMSDEMTATLAEVTAAEKAAIANYDELTVAKTKEVEASTVAIEAKTTRVGELAVDIVEAKNQLGDTEEALVEDKKFLANLATNCKTKQAEWDERCKMRGEELLALADTIKMLNSDDALELFKKTLPGASSSFVQLKVSNKALRARALAAIRSVAGRTPQLDFIALAIKGKKIGFEKVITMIDEMVVTLKKEQQDDDHKKEYCEDQFDMADDKKTTLERDVKDLETAISKAEDGIVAMAAEIEALDDGIKALDKSVAEATEQRKEENEDYTELMAGNSAAKELIGMAKNRMNKFYNPKLYKEPAAFVQHKADPGAPPSADFGGKKTEESSGVIGMMDDLMKELTQEMTEAEAEEKNSQGDYETLMKDSADKRAEDSKAMADDQGAKANLEADLGAHSEDKASAANELAATNQYIASLHGECDWIIKYFDLRKDARANEIDAMEKAKAVLSGADFSLVQTKSVKFLGRQ